MHLVILYNHNTTLFCTIQSYKQMFQEKSSRILMWGRKSNKIRVMLSLMSRWFSATVKLDVQKKKRFYLAYFIRVDLRHHYHSQYYRSISIAGRLTHNCEHLWMTRRREKKKKKKIDADHYWLNIIH